MRRCRQPRRKKLVGMADAIDRLRSMEGIAEFRCCLCPLPAFQTVDAWIEHVGQTHPSVNVAVEIERL